MSGRRRYTEQQVINALNEAHGLKGPAAHALHCTRDTITNYINRCPAIKQVYDDAIQDSIDVAHSRLMALVEKDDWRAIRYTLSTLGKDRGFTERQEIVAVGDDAEALRQQFLDDIRKVYGDEDQDDQDDD